MSNEEKNTAAPRVQSPDARKKTQRLIGWGAFAAVMAVAVVSAVFFENSPTASLAPQQQQQPAMQTSIAAPGGNVNAQDVWVGKSESQLSTLTEGQKSLFLRLEQLEKGGGASQQFAQAQPVSAVAVAEPQPLIAPDRRSPPPPPPTAKELPPPPPDAVDEPVAQPQPMMRGISMGRMDDAGAAQPAAPVATAQAKSADHEGNDVTNYIPAGSFAKVTMLGGMDAPTGGQAQTNPQPVLLRVDGDAILPNKFKYQVKECLVVASGYGEVASERAYIRTESMSCILENGETIDVAIKGYIAGEDGKTGLRGKLVTKQGQMLANALLAGIGSGIGQAFQQNAMTSSVSALGSTQTVQPGKALESGISSGVGKALDRLASYYISLAEKTFPIIEIDAGRTVDLVLTKGVSFKTKNRDNGVTLEDVAIEGRNVSRGRIGGGYYD